MPPTSSADVIAGRYRLDALLGRGGMGEVRAGTDLRLDREVAVKLLREDLAHQAELRARFEREARAAARISHPNVVAVFDTGEHRRVPFIVMERLPGSTLADELAGGSLSQARACTLVIEILSAIEAAHRLGILHRDIKPGNILRADNGHAKVTDFGIAKVAEDPDPGTTGILLGTAAYLAPERLEGEPATPASDLYSVGVVLFEVLAGRPPFQADTPLGLVRSITGERPPLLAELRPDVEPAVIAVAERAIAKDPRKRFGSASAMATALAAAMEHPRAIEDRPTIPVATARDVRRTPAPSALGTTAVLPHPPPSDDTAPTDAQRRRTRSVRRATAWVAGTIAVIVSVAVLLAVLTSRRDEPAPSEPTPSSQVARPTAIPEPLRRAIDELDRAVQP